MSRSSNTTWNDMLFNIIMCLFLLMLIAVVLVNPESKNEGIEVKAEYVITLTWPDESKDDVDIMVKLPNKKVINFKNKDHSLVSLDRDDQGQITDRLLLPDGEIVEIKENMEHVTIRKLMTGMWVVNIVMWTKVDILNTTANVKIEQLNPYRLIHSRDIELEEQTQEETAFRFTVKAGKIVDMDSIFEQVIPQQKGR